MDSSLDAGEVLGYRSNSKPNQTISTAQMDSSLDAGEVLGYRSNSNKFRDRKGRHDRQEESPSHFLGEAVFDKNIAGASSKNKDKKADATAIATACLHGTGDNADTSGAE